MKRQSRILAGTAIALLMASAPLSALPLYSVSHPAADATGRLPLVRVQADCPEGETCAPGTERKPREKRQSEEKQNKAAPAQEAAPVEQAPTEQAAPDEPEQKPRKQRQSEQKPDKAAPTQQAAPAEQAPTEQAAPAEPEHKPRKKRQSEQKQDKAAPVEEAAPAEQAAPAEPEQKPRKQRQSEQKPDKTAPAQQAAPAEKAAPAEPEQKPRKQQKQKQAEPAPAETAPSSAEQPADQGAESGSKKDKLRDYLKKKQNGEAAPAEKQPAEQTKPAEEPAPKPGQKPAEATQPAQGEQPAEQTGEPKSKQDKLRDYLNKKKQGSEAAPAEKQPAEQPTNGQKTGETPPAGEQTGNEEKPATQPELPADTKAQPQPKGEAEAKPLPENAAPLPDSAKNAGKTQPAGKQTEGANGQPAGQTEGKPEAAPDSDSAAQNEIGKIGKIESVEAVEGKRIDRNQWQQERRKRREEERSRNDGQVVKEINNRIVIRQGDNIYIDNRDANARLERHARDSYVEELPHDFSRYTIVKDDGTRIVTIRNADGDIVRRSRITPDDREVVLYYVPESDYGRMRGGYYDAGADLPPLRLDIPADEYILDAQDAQPDDYYTYLDAPPVEPVERIYSIDEVVHSARIRDKVRRVDLDTITFDTGSAAIGENQVNHLQALGDAINKILQQNPAETFLIEGHTDAVGSDESNLVLSDERAQSVAEALTSVFDIPAENLTTQGYGERYLKVNIEGANRENRRVAIRRITPLVAPVASAQ